MRPPAHHRAGALPLLKKPTASITRHKSYSLPTCTVEEAAVEMEALDYDFHLFTEEGTGQDSVLYREGPTEYRLKGFGCRAGWPSCC